MNELIEKIGSQTTFGKLVLVLEEFMHGRATSVHMTSERKKRYVIGEDYIISISYSNSPHDVGFAIKDRCFCFRYNTFCPLFYILNGGLDEIKNKLLNESNLTIAMDDLDVEEVFDVDIHWVTKRIDVKSALNLF